MTGALQSAVLHEYNVVLECARYCHTDLAALGSLCLMA